MKSFIVYLFVAAIFASLAVLICECCSCMPIHPQEHYCRSDFVILARVRRELGYNRNSGDRVYKTRIRKEFKMSDKAREALKSGRILTSWDEATCGVKFDVGKTYLITGRVVHLHARVSLCGMINIPWNKFTKRQRKGLRVMYGRGCQCKIQQCRNYYHDGIKKKSCYPSKNSCPWFNWSPDLSDCYSRYGFCLSSVRNRQCRWVRNNDLLECNRNLYNTTKFV